MKRLRWLSLGAAIIFCFTLSAPMAVEASSHKKQAVSHKATEKKVSSGKKSSSASKKTLKREAARHAKKTRQAAENRNVKKQPEKTRAEQGEREIWLKRARESDMLSGKASWFGKDFHNKPTASGLAYDMHTFTAAHRTLPLGTVVKVTDASNGKSVMVCVTDRGPFVPGRIIDLSVAAAKRLDLYKRGVGSVRLEVVSDEKGAPLKAGHAYFVRYASGNGKKEVGPFDGFADASAMREALSQAHPEAEVILEKSGK